MTNFTDRIFTLATIICSYSVMVDYPFAQDITTEQAEFLNAISPSSNSDTYQVDRYQFYVDHIKYKKIQKQANSGNILAQYELGNIYRNGQGVNQSDVIALMWYIISERNGVPSANKEKIFIKQNMANDRIALAQTMANIWIKKYKTVN